MTKVPPGTIPNLHIESPEPAICFNVTVTLQHPRRSFSSIFASIWFFFVSPHANEKETTPSKKERKDKRRDYPAITTARHQIRGERLFQLNKDPKWKSPTQLKIRVSKEHSGWCNDPSRQGAFLRCHRPPCISLTNRKKKKSFSVTFPVQSPPLRRRHKSLVLLPDLGSLNQILICLFVCLSPDLNDF